MIDKIIHCIWLGNNKIPKSNLECMKTWSKLKGFKIKKWVDSDFDIENMPYVKNCLDKKLYAFAADYLKCYVLYHHGGLYMDCDVFIHESFEHLFTDDLDIFVIAQIDKQCTNMKNLNKNKIADFMVGGIKGHPIFEQVLKRYDNCYNTACSLQPILSNIVFSNYNNIKTFPYASFDRDHVHYSNDFETIPLYTKHLFNCHWALEYVKHYNTDHDLQFSEEYLNKIREHYENDINY